ncbi:PREDICTED: putative disease resistance RPP13-like protein 1 [Lupinus angustifolius]|uniref:putative disease resistance RPP13-like protein 1 n=1 Tax=Lupinus angustifolius TaxID=3871 RepID=UPI00092EE027|nr:PREDICTED: putative disease resistance RPP13-like protein 1 [Lupinus angustifolius]
MASAVVGGAFLSGFVNVVFDRLLSPEALNLIQGKKLDQHLVQRLKTSLLAAEALVTDAEMKQFHDENIKTWLDSLKYAVYDADDLLDLILTQAATQNKKKCEEFDIVKITQTIIEAVTRGPCNTKDLSLLQEDLKGKLSGKKFFIVLDDVWNDDRHLWNNFQTPFQYGVKGSKILVTTRSKDVASVVQSCPPYILNELSDEYCWSVFKDNASYDESSGNPALEEIGRKIVKKCKGLPLAVETLGGLLRTKHDTKNWNAILESEVWEFSVKDSKIVPALLISYYHLPSYLKRCFVYCSLFPKDYTFTKDELILLWMAEDLLEQPKRGKTFEEIGCEYFDTLVSRLFFKQFSTRNDFFVMHDLMHDLAISIGGNFYSQFEDLGNADEMSTETRHLSYKRLTHPISKDFDAFSRIKSLRTLLHIDCSTPSPFSNENITLSNNKCLRVLSIGPDRELNVLPDSICKLIHLRYLSLCTNMKTLPDSLGDLYNLQTLKLSDCTSLNMLPNSMQNLVNLRHLDIRETPILEMPPGMSKLKKLHFLSDFVVGKHKENGIMELGELSNLHGSLCISKLENVANSSDALKARIMDKTHIDMLFLEWSLGVDMVTSSESERDILDKLKPHEGLQVLSIRNYKGTKFMDWVGHPSYRNMTHLVLQRCINCWTLPSLGQLSSLKSLEIRNFDGLVNIGDDFYKYYDDQSSLEASFPSLEDLTFLDLPCWEEWQSSEHNAFPKLKTLAIDNCPSLKGNLPSHLPALETVSICDCPQLASSLPKAHAIQHLCIYRSNKVLLQEIPLSLQSITISEREVVKYLESLSVSQSQVVALRTLQIWECDNFASFPIEGLAVPSMTYLGLYHCEKLKSLPCHMNTHLPNLERLDIYDCPEIELFPDGGLPPNLKKLIIRNSDKLLSNLSSIGVHEGLTNLHISGPCESVKSFPKDLLLPQLPALTTLKLYDFPKMKTLDCEELLHLTSLQVFIISECPELRYMTGERLPASLIQLQIKDSLCLEELCKMKDPNIWPKISHIPDIQINRRRLT